jgi:hypothetical protein
MQYHALISKDFKVIRFDCAKCDCQLQPNEYEIK